MVPTGRLACEGVLPSLGRLSRAAGCPQTQALALLAAILLHASISPTTDAFSVQMQNDAEQPDLESYNIYNNNYMSDSNDASETIDDMPGDHVDEYLNVMKRYLRPYRRWGHRSRFAWRYMKDRMCYRQRCKYDKDCCRRWSLCDKSAKVCTDCWYGSNCKTEQDCCMRYPYCVRTWKRNPTNGRRYIAGGKCVAKL